MPTTSSSTGKKRRTDDTFNLVGTDDFREMESTVHKVQMTGTNTDTSSRYHEYWEEMPCFLSVHDRDFRIIDGNRRFREFFGERVGEYCFRVYKGRDEICPNCPVEATFADGCNHPSEQLLTTKDGHEIPVMVHTTPIKDDQGQVVAVMEMHTDIGEVKRLQSMLQRSQERLAQLFEEVPCFITVQGPDRIIQHANRRFRETFGDAVGNKCYTMYKHRDEQCLVCPMQQTFDTGETREHEEVLFTKDGQKLNGLCTTAPLHGADGRVEAVIEMCIDITQIRELQSQLASIGLLVGSISHGIKGLLTGLDGGIYMVNSGFAKAKPERVEKGWEMVQRNVERIRSMVLDILYYAKDRELVVEDVDLVAIVEDFREGLEKKASDANIEVGIDIADDVDVFQGDPQAIRAMLLNLLENSLDACRMDKEKDTHEISMTIRRETPWVLIDVEDNGIGMDRETREKVFSLFFSSKGIKGTGLGLFISNKIVDKHGGDIKVFSEPGRGTRFEVRLPLQANPSIKPADRAS
jgi:PAS domain S-box-containing protein